MGCEELARRLRESGFQCWTFARSEVTRLAAAWGWQGALADAGVDPHAIAGALDFWDAQGNLLVVLAPGYG